MKGRWRPEFGVVSLPEAERGKRLQRQHRIFQFDPAHSEPPDDPRGAGWWSACTSSWCMQKASNASPPAP